jgi:hypothetical protein
MPEAVDRFREILKRYINRDELVEIYEDSSDEDKFEVGFVVNVTEDTYTLDTVDTVGRYNGVYIGDLNDIIRIAAGTQYLAGMELLVQHQIRSADNLGWKGPKESARRFPTFSSTFDLANYAKENRMLVQMVDGAKGVFYGFVKNLSAEHIELLEVNRLGIEDGLQFLALNDIVRIDFGGPHEDARAFLHRVRMGL